MKAADWIAATGRSYNVLKAEELETLQQRPREQTVVITGRGARQYLKDAADTVTEMRADKHAFHEGIAARTGIGW